MALLDLARLLALRWVWLAAAAVLGLVLAGVYYLMVPPRYVSSAQLFVGSSLPPGKASPAAAVAASEYVLDRMPSYTVLVHTPSVTQTVADDLGVPGGAAAVDSMVSAVVPAKTVLITVSAKATTADQASKVASDTAKQLALAIEQIETPRGAASPLVRVTTVRSADVPSHPSSGGAVLVLGLGVLLGLAAGAGGALLAGRPQEIDLREPAHAYA